MFTPPKESVLLQTFHWRIHHNLHSRVEGYLMLGTLHKDGYDFDSLPSEALAEMGSIIERAVSAIKKAYQPKHVLVSRYGVATREPPPLPHHPHL